MAKSIKMTPARLPMNEQARLKALYDLLILDTPPEERFDRIVRFAAEQLDMPIALVTMVDAKRQWFKAKVGLAADETSREVAFCAHTILQTDLFVVEDASQDPRFHDNPLVTGAPHIRFYAGAPLSAPTGEALGSLCVIDSKPRQLSDLERAILWALKGLVNEAIRREEIQ